MYDRPIVTEYEYGIILESDLRDDDSVPSNQVHREGYTLEEALDWVKTWREAITSYGNGNAWKIIRRPVESWKAMGEVCPACNSAFLKDGPGGGVVCEDEDCGYWFCY